MVPVLAYHEVSMKLGKNHQIRSMHPSCCMSVDNFREQLKHIDINKYCTGFFEEISSSLQTGYSDGKRRYIAITFDDGHIGNYRYAYPLLKNGNQKAIFFVTIDYIGHDNMMNWKQIRDMSESGMSIQSHCVTHKPLETLMINEIEYELKESKRIIESELGQRVDTVSVPHGSYTQDVIRIAKEIDYKYVCTSNIGFMTAQLKENIIIPRIGVRAEYPIKKFASLLNPFSLDHMILYWQSTIKNSIRTFIGIDRYRKIYRIISNIEE